MVDTYRGVLRLRAWPKKRGRPKSQAVRNQNAWFKEAVRLIKIADPGQQKIAIEAAGNTGLYPRDLLMNAMAGGMFDIDMDDGRVITFHDPVLENVMFQGTILQQASVQSLPGNVYTTLTWTLPVIDTGAFWNAGAPTRLTIPAGVEVVNLFAGWKRDGLVLNGTQVPALRKNGTFLARAPTNVNGWPGGFICSGPRAVVANDWFDFQVFVAAATQTTGDQETFFAMQVLQVQ